VEAPQWFAAAHLLAHTPHRDWPQVTSDDIRAWLAGLLERYSDSYVNNQGRGAADPDGRPAVRSRRDRLRLAGLDIRHARPAHRWY
jgi:hypothetical protein